MFRDAARLVTLGAVLCGGLLGPLLRAEPLKKQTSVVNNSPVSPSVQVEDLHPFTRLAYIPADTDMRTIRFEKVNTVKVPTKITYTTDTNYCAELAFLRDPGGSMECPRRRAGSLTTAYEVTYSYRGQPLASDEYGIGYLVFQVYFRPDELVSTLRSVLASRKLSRAEKASYFKVTTSREHVQQVVIDEGQSTLCDKMLVDGVWSNASPNCQERIKYMVITTPSDYIAVRVDPVPAP
jgi:hypothetical protein